MPDKELIRETLGIIARFARDIEDEAMQGDIYGLRKSYAQIDTNMKRLEMLLKNMGGENGKSV